MLFFSNRGNTTGPSLSKENSPLYVTDALKKGFHVVVDTWVTSDPQGRGTVSLGDVYPQYPVTMEFMKLEGIVARAKTLSTYQHMIDNDVHAFLDGPTSNVSSEGLVWTKPGSKIGIPKSVLNMPELITSNYIEVFKVREVAGFCSNFIETVRDEYNNEYLCEEHDDDDEDEDEDEEDDDREQQEQDDKKESDHGNNTLSI